MTVIISGSAGIQNVLGSAAAPAESNTTSSNTGMYFPTSTTLGFSTAGTNAVTIDTSQNVKVAAKLLNSSGNPIVLQSGSVLKVQQFTDAGSTTTSGSLVNLNASAFSYTPVSTNSTLYLTITAYAYNNPAGGYGASVYTFYNIGEFISGAWVAISNTGYLWNYQYVTTYAQSIAVSAYMTCTRSNSSLTARSFDLLGGTSNSNVSFTGANIIFTVMEVAN
jgi:hypothetical protein